MNSDILRFIGNTPLARLSRIFPDARVFAKLEYLNPMGSVKDRIALAMIEALEKNALLDNRSVIVEATSGNTGIGVAMVCAVKSYRCMIVMPENMSRERQAILRALGAEVILTPPILGMEGAVRKASEIVSSNPNAFSLNQFSNPVNPAVHFDTTAQEIWRDMDGDIDCFICGIGTGGTITGVGRFLKQNLRRVKIIGVLPERFPHKIEGIGAGFKPDVLDESVIDEVIKVSDEYAFAYTERLAKEEGIFAGPSSGAVAYACALLKENGNIVALFPDTGHRYLYEGLAQ